MTPIQAAEHALLLTTAALLLTQVPDDKEPGCDYGPCGKVASDFAWCGMQHLTVRPVCREHRPPGKEHVSTREVRNYMKHDLKRIKVTEPDGSIQLDRDEIDEIMTAAVGYEFDVHITAGRFLSAGPGNEKAREWLKKHRSHA